ncbi:hypothetical protein CAXC1_210005 [Candidatus Xenohaliotis californiensis]|uniref:Uncharacterized protein n=1 Tax=Candidatus Xenohaliotis californiensis TaxID=84677 RepID=A0ABM9N7N3_9RICK|nr:hypothetical protein CAXC1_210005 [Candidatus Xenohaliotis californiensis]
MDNFFNAYTNMFNTHQCNDYKNKFQSIAAEAVEDAAELISNICCRTTKMASNIASSHCTSEAVNEYFGCAKDNIDNFKKYATAVHRNIEKNCCPSHASEMEKKKP